MGLTGSEATCAVSEVFKGLLNGEEFYYYYDSENLCTVLKLADNSSWLEFSDWGYINSLINRADLQNKYNGGMCLGNFSYSDGSEIVSNLKRLSNSFSIAPILVGLVSALADSGMYVISGVSAEVLIFAMPYVLFALSVAQIYLILDLDSCVGVGEDEYWIRQKEMNYSEYYSQINQFNGINNTCSIKLNKLDINEFYQSQEELNLISKYGGDALDPRKDPEKMGVKLALLIEMAKISYQRGEILNALYSGILASSSVLSIVALTIDSLGEEVYKNLKEYIIRCLDNSNSK